MTTHTNGDLTLEVNAIVGRYATNAVFDRDRLRSPTYFEGRRRIYEVVGYPEDITFDDYLHRYERGDLAERIVNAKADETWRKPPKILDGKDKESARDDTEFAKTWQQMADFDELNDDTLLADSKNFWFYFRQVDRMMALGGYAILLLGIDDRSASAPGMGLKAPLGRRSRGLSYLSVYTPNAVTIPPDAIVRDPFNKRFGLPEHYQVQLDDMLGALPVHHTRVIHVTETDDLKGVPILRSIWNRLIDLEKVLAASGEAGWRMAIRKIIITTKEGHTLSEATVPAEDVKKLLHDLKDVVGLGGADVTVLDGTVVDPSALIDTELDFIAGAKGIPKRILVGSERGELASSQDETNWYNQIAERQTSFAEPSILRPFIYRLIYAGLLPMPSSGSVFVDWPSLYELDDQQQAATALTYAQTLTQLASPGVERVADPRIFAQTYMRGLPADAIPNEAELLAIEERMMESAEDDDAGSESGDGPDQNDRPAGAA